MKFTPPADMTDEEFLEWIEGYRKHFDGQVAVRHVDQLVKRLRRRMEEEDDGVQ